MEKRGVFVRSWRLIGMTNYMMNVYADPEFLHQLAKIMLDYSLAQLDLLPRGTEEEVEQAVIQRTAYRCIKLPVSTGNIELPKTIIEGS